MFSEGSKISALYNLAMIHSVDKAKKVEVNQNGRSKTKMQLPPPKKSCVSTSPTSRPYEPLGGECSARSRVNTEAPVCQTGVSWWRRLVLDKMPAKQVEPKATLGQACSASLPAVFVPEFRWRREAARLWHPYPICRIYCELRYSPKDASMTSLS
jgi:hypothetical protein